eukprot:TRINITY_DN10662_c0_g1_i4.p1 TRINITY_DN10662_c0_g1~~TRINITY_DN10662_c0_g1_i4.p1  ORF type:complete len:114 (+),score=38.67 TRINITY_DN10662_c0_g1_i4:388-729(+)
MDLDDIHPSWVGEDDGDDAAHDDDTPLDTPHVGTPCDDDSGDRNLDEGIAAHASFDSEHSDDDDPLFSAEELGMPQIEADLVPGQPSHASSVYHPRRKLPVHRNVGEGSSENP